MQTILKALLLIPLLLLSATAQVTSLYVGTNGVIKNPTPTTFWSANAPGASAVLVLKSSGTAYQLSSTNTHLQGSTFLEGIGVTDKLLVVDDQNGLGYVNVSPAEASRLAGVTGGIQTNIDARSRWLNFPTNTFGTTTITNISLKAHGVSALVFQTAGDLQDLASLGVFDETVAIRVRVQYDSNGTPLPGGGRWYAKNTTDTRTSDGVTIILPIDVPSDASPGRWVLEGYEP